MIADLAQKPNAPTQANATIAAKEPAAGQKAALGGDDPRTLARALRKELERVGCTAGAADGPWDDRSKQALAEFSRHAKVSLPGDAPTAAALEAVQARKERVCPLKCGKGEIEDDGECVAKVRDKRQPSRARAEGGSEAKPKLCWSTDQNGRQSVAPCVR
jgi:hypothetical protein